MHYLFWPKPFFGPKQCKPGHTIKIVISAEIAQNQNCAFLKTLFLQCFQQNTAFQKQKLYVKKQKIYEKLWVVFEDGKMVFWGFVSFRL